MTGSRVSQRATPREALGTFLRRSDAADLTERIRRGYGAEARFVDGGDAARLLVPGQEAHGSWPEAPAWALHEVEGGGALAILPLEMPAGDALVLQLGPLFPGDDGATGLARGDGGGLALIQELVVGTLERRRLEVHLERRERALAATMERSERHGGYQDLVRLAVEVGGGSAGALFRPDPGTGAVSRLAARHGELPMDGLDLEDETGPLPVAQVLGEGRPRHLPPAGPWAERYLAPVPGREAPLGCLVVVAEEGEALRPLERRLVDGVAEQVRRHLERVEGERRSRHRIDHLERLHEIEERIHGTLDLVDVVETALELAETHLGGRSQSLLVLGDGSQDLHVRDASGRFRVYVRHPYDEDRGAWVRFMDNTKAQRVRPDRRVGARVGYFPTGSQEAVGCLLGPVHRPVGALMVALDRPVRPADLEAIQLIALPVGRALKNAVLFEKGERQIAELSLINELGKALNSSLDLEDVLHYVVDMIASVLEADRGSLMLLDRSAGELYIEVATGLSEKGRRLRMPVGQGIAGYVAASQSPVLSRNTATDVRYLVDHVGPAEPLTLISAPVTCRGKLLGVLNFERPLARAESFSIDDLELLSTLASQAGIAIENAGLYNDLVQVYFDTIKSLASALEAKDIYTHGHSRRVAKDAVRIARRLGLGKRQLEMIRHGALLHDIGKIGIRDSILFKPGPLDADELQHIRSHPVMGATIMASFDVLKDVRDIIRYHHERWDGAGFPDGLSGPEIPLGARIVCVADSFDAMITSRPYREGMPIPRALDILVAERGKQFDPELVDVFVDVIRSIHPALEAARG